MLFTEENYSSAAASNFSQSLWTHVHWVTKENHIRGNDSADLKPLLEKQLKGHVQLKVVGLCGLQQQKQGCVRAKYKMSSRETLDKPHMKFSLESPFSYSLYIT